MCVSAMMATAAGLQVGGALLQHRTEKSGLKTADAQAKQNFAFQVLEGIRQVQEVQTEEQEAVSDRMRQARAELGALTVAAAEAGASAASAQALLVDTAGSQGTDIARIRRTADSKRESIRSSIQAGALQLGQTRASLKTRSRGADLGLFSSMLQIGANTAMKLDE